MSCTSCSVTGAGLDAAPRNSAKAAVSLSIFSSSRRRRWSVDSPAGAWAGAGLDGNNSQAPARATANAQKLVDELRSFDGPFQAFIGANLLRRHPSNQERRST